MVVENQKQLDKIMQVNEVAEWLLKSHIFFISRCCIGPKYHVHSLYHENFLCEVCIVTQKSHLVLKLEGGSDLLQCLWLQQRAHWMVHCRLT